MLVSQIADALPRAATAFVGGVVVVLLAMTVWDLWIRRAVSATRTAGALRGSTAGAVLAIAFAVASVPAAGWLAPQAMVGDEVTHYYMLTRQAQELPRPTYFARIPTGWGRDEVRRYPHPNLWHYAGAAVYRLAGRSFLAVQLYQGVFWAQFLIAAFLLARSREGADPRAVFLYVLVLSSLPMALLFSVLFYQDVPAAAQVLTSFHLLRRRRWLWAAVFMALAAAMKVTALLFLPPFLFLFLKWLRNESAQNSAAPCRLARQEPATSEQRRAVSMAPSSGATAFRGRDGAMARWRSLALVSAVAFIIGGSLGLTAWSLDRYGKSGYYPLEQFRQAWRGIAAACRQPAAPVRDTRGSQPVPVPSSITAYEAEIIANHPGDLRNPLNLILYGGILLWPVLLFGLTRWTRERLMPGGRRARAARFARSAELGDGEESRAEDGRSQSSAWLWGTGAWSVLATAVHLRSAPDARFFLPGLPFLLLPAVEAAVRWPRSKALLAFCAAAAIVQGSQVLAKARDLRRISPALREAAEFLARADPRPRRLFMYPEGNYRVFPAPHEWYLRYHLRDFWRAGNDDRIEILRSVGVDTIVIKKHLIAHADPQFRDLGVYPAQFVADLRQDVRFEKTFENAAVIVFRVPRRPSLDSTSTPGGPTSAP